MTERSGNDPRNGGADSRNNSSRVSWDAIAKVSQIAILPLLATAFYILLQMSSFDRRLAIIEVTTRTPPVDISTLQKLAIIEDRQNSVIRTLGDVEMELKRHRERSDYDPQGINGKFRK